MVGIYKITNPKGKIYIGESINIEKRWKQYEAGHANKQWKLSRSIKKYGWDQHTIEIVEQCGIDQLRERERYWQLYYNSIMDGLNLKLTGIGEIKTIDGLEVSLNRSKGQRGRKHTKETKELLSRIRKGKPKPQGYGKKQSQRLTGRKLTEDHSLNIAKSKEKPCVINGILYDSCKKASIALNIPTPTLFYRLRSKKYTDCWFI